MGLTSSVPELKEIRDETGFSRAHIVRLHMRFSSMAAAGHILRREDFLKGGFVSNPFRDRILDLFFEDENGSQIFESINFRKFIRTLAYFRPAVENKTPDDAINSRLSKLRVTFKLMDVDGDGKLSRQDMLYIVEKMINVKISDEELSSIVDRAFLEADQDGDGMISFEEFVKMAENVPMEEKLSLRFLLM